LPMLCLCPDTLSEAEFKSNGLINLAEEFQDRMEFRLWHAYCRLLLARFTVRIRSKKQSRRTWKCAVWPEREWAESFGQRRCGC
jgi:hypothetical protein